MTVVHVVPLHDSVAHAVPGGVDGHDDGHHSGWLVIEAGSTARDEDCACGPDVECVPNPLGPDGWLVTHHSLDGREQAE